MVKNALAGCGGLFLLLVVVGALAGGGDRDNSSDSESASSANPSSTSSSSSSSRSTPSAKPALEVSAFQLFEDYHANEVAADDKYKGKQILVSGNVDGIKKAFMGDYIVTVMTSNQFMPIRCDFGKSAKSTIAKLSKGISIKIQGKCHGMVVGHVALKGCRIVE